MLPLLIGQKLIQNAKMKKSNATFWVIFKQCEVAEFLWDLTIFFYFCPSISVLNGFCQILLFRLAVVALAGLLLWFAKYRVCAENRHALRRRRFWIGFAPFFLFEQLKIIWFSQRKRGFCKNPLSTTPVCLMQFFAVPWDTMMMMMRSSTYRYCATHTLLLVHS